MQLFDDTTGVLRGVAELEVHRLEFDSEAKGGDLTGTARLSDFGFSLLQKILSPESVKFDLLICGGARSDPSIARSTSSR